VAEHDEAFVKVVDALKEPVRIAPDLTTRVMAEIERLPVDQAKAEPTPPRFAWARRRWTLRLSPLGALATAAGLAAVVLAGSRIAAPGETSGRQGAGEAAESMRPTQFVLVAPQAASVTVVGDFNDWNPSATPLASANGGGVWWVTVPLPPGRYRYAFVVNGTTWLADPEASAVEHEFGRPSSVVTIGGA
jgi:Carbohydrate-binding module 48 (Isoamylase N-terminal domain)